MTSRDGSAVETALRQADMAMYWAKAEGRGRYRFFDHSMDEQLQQRVELEAEIKGAMAAGQIVPYYQPLVDLDSGKTVGFEVLARWEHPRLGVLMPDLFIPIAEDTGTIGEMTDRLLERAMHDAMSWPEQSLRLDQLLAAADLRSRCWRSESSACSPRRRFLPTAWSSRSPRSAVVQRLDDAKAVLQSLRNVGVRVALDDFGTGYSGLYHLRELELDIDQDRPLFVTKMLEPRGGEDREGDREPEPRARAAHHGRRDRDQGRSRAAGASSAATPGRAISSARRYPRRRRSTPSAMRRAATSTATGLRREIA